MRETLRVTWTVTPLRPPQPWLHCSHCNTSRKFLCSGKFRVNAQKKRIDAWLIYRCEICEESWNLPIVERALVASFDERTLAGFTHNDVALAMRHAFDLARLRRHALRIETCSEPSVDKACVNGSVHEPEVIAIRLVAPHPSQMRLDQLLSREAYQALASQCLLRMG